MSIEGRIAALERVQGESGTLVVFGKPTPEQVKAIEEAQRIGRPVLRWPVAPPPIECVQAER